MIDEQSSIVDNIFDDLEEPTFFEKIWWRLYCYYSDTKYFFRRISQRFRYGFPLEQSWDFKSWHADAVLPRLRHFRNNLSGHPCNLGSLEEWTSILDQIIWSFENYEETPSPVYSDGYDKRFRVTKSDGYTTYSPMNETGTVDWAPLEEHHERVQKGLSLFAEHYQSLWD